MKDSQASCIAVCVVLQSPVCCLSCLKASIDCSADDVRIQVYHSLIDAADCNQVIGKKCKCRTGPHWTHLGNAVSCGWYHSLAVDTAGNAWGWGLDNYGQCSASPWPAKPKTDPAKEEDQEAEEVNLFRTLSCSNSLHKLQFLHKLQLDVVMKLAIANVTARLMKIS